MTHTTLARGRLEASPDARDDVRWRAVLARDATWDGRFVYAVRSTGVYCRPSCPSRKPGRGRVEFFAGPAAAERAGYRACRRCGPDVDGAADERLAAAVRDACALLRTRAGETIRLRDLAGRAGLSPYHFQRAFKRLVGVTPAHFAAAERVGRLKAGLLGGRDVTGAALRAGYGSSSRVYEPAARELGMTPGRYRAGGAGVTIRFTIAPTALGRALVAATDRGVCAIALGDDDAGLEAALRAEFHAADVARDDAGLAAWADAVARHAGGTLPDLRLPLDVRATAIQRRVWQELQRIPRGQTRTYREIAVAIGQPAAARAVGRACATNPIALAVPCHRAVRADGSRGEYRWGKARKERLLKAEAAAASINAAPPDRPVTSAMPDVAQVG